MAKSSTMERRQAHLGAPDPANGAPIRPGLPRLAPPIILVPLVSGSGLRSCLSATACRRAMGGWSDPVLKERH